jgi:uroporphyrinogen decarboxylase
MVQADAGAQVVQIFDSWASQLSPQDFEIFSAPYIKQIISDVRKVNLHFLPSQHHVHGARCASEQIPCVPDAVC